MTIQDTIRRWASDSGDRTFLVSPEHDETLSYLQLDERLSQVAAKLDAMGVGAGEHVAILMDNGQWTATLLLALMASGRVAVPLNAIAGDSQLEYVLDHCDADLVFASPAHEERAAQLTGRVKRPIRVIPTCPDRGPEWDAGAAAGAQTLPAVDPDDTALLMYTSGTTGKPKGVMLSHRNVLAGGMNTVEAHTLSREDRGLCVLPLYHINAEIVTLIAPLISGGSVVMPHRFSTRAFWELIREQHCTWFSVVPTIVTYLLEQANNENPGVRDNPDFSRVRFGRSASSALPVATHKAFEEAFGIPLIETMGLTETAAQILSNPLPPFQTRYGSPGVAYRNRVKVVSEDGAEATRGEIGELVVQGDNVMQGYYKNPEATQESLDAKGWFYTGDLGYQDDEDFFFITGRLKELIIKGGENIAPREIDETLLKHPAILEAAAFAIDDAHYGQDIMASVVLKHNKEVSGEELTEFCQRDIGKFKTPKEVLFVQWLPKGPSGKVQRLSIADMLDDLKQSPDMIADNQ
ncbi:AMP-binding protein [Halomonas garicola]|uniref:AMP-binding protein n=1 Tax=Halomonas garicola TaxID=1690008 RepID=UPI002899EC4E|nr:AMP-binding protein [Halomonas garicola]